MADEEVKKEKEEIEEETEEVKTKTLRVTTTIEVGLDAKMSDVKSYVEDQLEELDIVVGVYDVDVSEVEVEE